MTLQLLPNIMSYPGMFMSGSAAPAIAAGNTLDAAGEYDCLVFCAQEDMVISHVGFRCASATGSPTADVRIETVDASTKLPTGTLWAANTNIVTGTLTSAWAQHALTAAATITKGQMFAVKIAYNSGTSLTVGIIGSTVAGSLTRGLPYKVVNTGTPTISAAGSLTTYLITLGSSATTFYKSTWVNLPYSAVTANAFNNTSSAIRGARFQVPFKCRVVGIRHHTGAAIGNYNALLMNDAGTELSSSSTAVDGDIGSSNLGPVEIFFDNPVTLDPATWYRVGIQPSSATNSSILTFGVIAAAYLTAAPGGSNFYYTAFTGTWADDTTLVPVMDILIDQLDDGAGAGGMLVHPGMNGRLAA